MHKLRRHKQSFASLAASVFMVVWLSMALAPCLMALGATPAAAAEGCAHCPDAPPPCHDDGATTCTYVDGYHYDGRDMSVALKDVRLAVIPVAMEPAAAEPAGRFAEPDAFPAPPDPGGPRLHLKNCILLD